MMEAKLIECTPNPEEVIERAARICYDSKSGDEERRSKFIKGLVKSGHTATIEHAFATFEISGVSRALTHELVRHRLFSFCQRSQRYCNEDGFEVVLPESIENAKVVTTAHGTGVNGCDEAMQVPALEKWNDLMGKIGRAHV